jgi:transcriptional regulator with XRE-family HTH domain
MPVSADSSTCVVPVSSIQAERVMMRTSLCGTSTRVKNKASTLGLVTDPPRDPSKICQSLRAFRERWGLTAEDVADGTGIKIDTLRKWEKPAEKGGSVPERSNLEVLASFYGCSMDDLYNPSTAEKLKRRPIVPAYVLRVRDDQFPDLVQEARAAIAAVQMKHQQRLGQQPQFRRGRDAGSTERPRDEPLPTGERSAEAESTTAARRTKGAKRRR